MSDRFSAPEPLTSAHEVSAFACGKPALDDWLRTRALSNFRYGFSAVLVTHVAGRVAGYYSLAPTAVVATTMPRSIRTGQPPHPVPCLLLGQFAVDLQWAGRGIGSALLAHALQRCVIGARLVGGRALVVHALDAQADAYWLRRGFLPSKDDTGTLFRSIADIHATLVATGQFDPGPA